MIDYSPLWETMKKRHISQYALINKGIDKHTLDQLRKNQNITILTVEKLCNILNCTPNDVFAFKDEKDTLLSGWNLPCLSEDSSSILQSLQISDP